MTATRFRTDIHGAVDLYAREAFNLLAAASQRANRKLRDIAQSLSTA